MGKGKVSAGPKPSDIARLERQIQQRHDRISALSMLDCLRTAPTDELERLVDLCILRAFPAHEAIIHHYDQQDSLYLILQGKVRLTLHDKEGREVLIGVFGRGDCYSTGALFGNVFSRAGAYTETNCYVLQLPINDLRAMLPATPTLNKLFHQIYLQRLAEFTLGRVPIFNHLEPRERLALTALLQSCRYPRDSVVVTQGSPADSLYLIESGQVVVEHNNHPIASLSEGDFFGEMSLLCDQPRSATVRTLTPTTILVLSAEEFERLLTQRPDLRPQFQHVLERRRNLDEKFQDKQERVQRLTVAVQYGLLRGRYLLVRTPELCPPGCRICEQACVARHHNLRLHLDGVRLGDVDIVDTCRQCRVGAECVEACPEDAFAWNDKGALFITDKCTGCGECVPACPYQALDRVPRASMQSGKLLLRLLGQAKRLQQMIRPVIPLEPVEYTHRADKCDLCHGYDDMACVSQCPTGSLRLVPVEEIFPL